jgi:signal peptidase II
MTFAIAALVFILDRIAKSAVIHYVSGGTSLPVLDGIFHITLVHNTGAAFGILRGGGWLFMLTSLAAIAAISFYALVKKPVKKSLAISLGLVMGGAAGNLFDRILYGHVIDFLDFRVWPVFNIADSCITTGTAVILFMVICTRYSSR